MTPYEPLLFWAALVLYTFAILVYLLKNIFKRDLKNLDYITSGIAFVAHSADIIFRWIYTGHPPAMGIYENALATSWIIALLFFILQWKFPKAASN